MSGRAVGECRQCRIRLASPPSGRKCGQRHEVLKTEQFFSLVDGERAGVCSRCEDPIMLSEPTKRATCKQNCDKLEFLETLAGRAADCVRCVQDVRVAAGAEIEKVDILRARW